MAPRVDEVLARYNLMKNPGSGAVEYVVTLYPLLAVHLDTFVHRANAGSSQLTPYYTYLLFVIRHQAKINQIIKYGAHS